MNGNTPKTMLHEYLRDDIAGIERELDALDYAMRTIRERLRGMSLVADDVAVLEEAPTP